MADEPKRLLAAAMSNVFGAIGTAVPAGKKWIVRQVTLVNNLSSVTESVRLRLGPVNTLLLYDYPVGALATEKAHLSLTGSWVMESGETVNARCTTDQAVVVSLHGVEVDA